MTNKEGQRQRVRPLLNRVIPYENESLHSFIIRLGKVNYKKGLKWLDEILGENQPKFVRVNPNLKYLLRYFPYLSKLATVPVETIYQMTVHRFSEKLCPPGLLEYDDWGRATLPQKDEVKVTSLAWSKYCPLCLGEGRHHKIHWDLRWVTSCMKHNILLVDSCPKCGAKLTVQDIIGGCHHCGSTLLEVNPTSILNDEPSITTQSFIQKALGVGEKNNLSFQQAEPALGLPAPCYFSLLYCIFQALSKITIPSELLKITCLINKPDGKAKFKNQMPNSDTQILLTISHWVLTNWPNNFYFFLDEYRKDSKVSHLSSGLTRDFLPLRVLLQGLEGPEFDFVRQAFQEYLLTKWDGGLLNEKVSYFRDQKELLKRRKYIGLEEAAEALGVSYKQVLALLKSGKLKYKTKKAGETQRFLIETQSIEDLRREWAYDFQFGEVCKRLNAAENEVLEIIKAGFLKSKTITLESSTIKLIEKDSVHRFEEEFFLSKETTEQNDVDELVSMEAAAGMLGFVNFSIGKMLNLAKEKVLTVYADPIQSGLKSIRFKLSDIHECIELLSKDHIRAVFPEGDINNSSLKALRRR